MKRIFVMLFAVCLTLPLFGCDSGGGGAAPADPPAAGGDEAAEGEDAGDTEEAAE